MRDTTWNVFAGGCGLVRGWYHKWWIVNSVKGNIFGRGVVGKIEESYVACLEVECDEASLLMRDSSLFKAQPLPPPNIDDDVDRQTQGQQVEHDEHDVKLRSNRNKVVVILDATEMLRKLLSFWEIDTGYQGMAEEVDGADFKTWRIAEGCDWRHNGRKKTKRKT